MMASKGWVIKKENRPQPFLGQLDNACRELRYINQQTFATRVVAFTTQDLLIAFGSFGMALFALNLYKLTKPANG